MQEMHVAVDSGCVTPANGLETFPQGLIDALCDTPYGALYQFGEGHQPIAFT